MIPNNCEQNTYFIHIQVLHVWSIFDKEFVQLSFVRLQINCITLRPINSHYKISTEMILTEINFISLIGWLKFWLSSLTIHFKRFYLGRKRKKAHDKRRALYFNSSNFFVISIVIFISCSHFFFFWNLSCYQVSILMMLTVELLSFKTVFLYSMLLCVFYLFVSLFLMWIFHVNLCLYLHSVFSLCLCVCAIKKTAKSQWIRNFNNCDKVFWQRICEIAFHFFIFIKELCVLQEYSIQYI